MGGGLWISPPPPPRCSRAPGGMRVWRPFLTGTCGLGGLAGLCQAHRSLDTAGISAGDGRHARYLLYAVVVHAAVGPAAWPYQLASLLVHLVWPADAAFDPLIRAPPPPAGTLSSPNSWWSCPPRRRTPAA
jgi:hypothetical protein